MRIILLIIILIQILLIIMIYTVSFNLRHYGGKWGDIGISIMNNKVFLILLYVGVAIMAFFLKKERKTIRTIIIILSIIGVYVCNNAYLFPW